MKRMRSGKIAHRSAADADIRTAYRAMTDSLEVADGLDKRVLARVEEHRDRERPDDTSAARLRAHRPVSRRACLAGFAAAAATVGGLLVPRFLVPQSSKTSTTARHAFALDAVTRGDSGQEGEALLSPDTLGMVPVGISNGLLVLFHFNLCVAGEGITRVTYCIHAAYDDTGSLPASEEHIPAVEFQEFRTWVDEEAGVARYAMFHDEEDASVGIPTSHLEFDGETALREGGATSPRGNPYLVVVHIPEEKFFSSDPLLELYGAYRSACSTAGREETDPWERHALRARVAAAQGAYQEALGELYADDERFFAWMRQCYRTCLGLAGDMLAGATVEAEVEFDDGATVTKDYLIRPVEDFGEKIGERFDAVVEARGVERTDEGFLVDASGRRIDMQLDGAPFWSIADGLPLSPAEDKRLREPLYRIVDVTLAEG